LLQLVLLAAFVVFNFFLLRWLARRLMTESEWLRDPEERAAVLKQHGLHELRHFLIFRHWGSWSSNPIAMLVGHVALTYAILWADYVTIREQWPWLLGR
jgi:hypothetical protein